MTILSFESSCDETSVAVTRDGRGILSNVIHSQADMHALYGGVVPEIASRGHIEVISALTDNALGDAGITRNGIDAIAATNAPGLIGALLVGLNFAKGAAAALRVPLIPVHHLRGHIAANYLAFPELEPPFLAVVVSGGNTVICAVRGYTEFEIIGQTRDDAAGECFDKAARAMGLGYPGGKILDDLAKTGDDRMYRLPRPFIENAPMDMSFSGLKTAVVNIINNAKQADDAGRTDDTGERSDDAGLADDAGERANTVRPYGDGTLHVPSLAASLSRAVSDVIVPRVMRAAEITGMTKIAVAGGVAANSRIRADLLAAADNAGYDLYLPPLGLCGDNAAMIGAQAFYEYKDGCIGGAATNAFASRDISYNGK